MFDNKSLIMLYIYVYMFAILSHIIFGSFIFSVLTQNTL